MNECILSQSTSYMEIDLTQQIYNFAQWFWLLIHVYVLKSKWESVFFTASQVLWSKQHLEETMLIILLQATSKFLSVII